jgi:16S rRNA G966 N2-methylase RsmD
MDAWKNQLFFGDNLEILRSGRIPLGSVDLIYLDPPFNPNATFKELGNDH